MKKPTKIEEAYHSLGRLENGAMSGEAVAEITRALTSSSSLLVSRAADIVGDRRLQELIPEMVSAFDTFMVDCERSDKQCKAKISIVNALNTLEYMGDSIFLIGVRHVQMEPAYGGPVDTAVKLRSGCAYGLARINHSDTHFILADLLVDKEHQVRAAAAKALAYLASPESELMLRLKVLTGDTDPEVISECFVGLMTIIPGRSLEFVSRFLESEESIIVEYAALAIGGSHVPQALDVLRTCWDSNPSPAARRAILLPIALVRSDDAVDFLTEVVSSSDIRTASHALSALRLYADDRSMNKIRAAVKTRNNADIVDLFEREFGERIGR